MLWKQSFDTGQIHHSFLLQLITPIHKGGSKFPPVNYRPVSLTSHLIKIFERVIQKKLVEYLEQHNLISSSQHGFRRGHSCLSELLDHYNELIDNLGAIQDSDVIYLDFSKAFDKVDHDLLIKKLQRYGITGKLLRWIKSFIFNRKQKVVVDGCHSYIGQVLSGIPQGSVLGPLLFLLFVNDMNQALEHSTLRMFADDSRLVQAIDPIHPENGMNMLNSDIDRILIWSEENNMELNESKFEFLSYKVHWEVPGVNMRLLKELPFASLAFERSYATKSGVTLNETDYVVDLGITLPNGFSFEYHINTIAHKANQKCFWILSVFTVRDPYVMLNLFKSLVLSVIEYCSPLWIPTNIEQIKTLESVQRRFTSKIIGMKELSYWERLKKLKLLSLQRRRERFAIFYLWKIINGKVPNSFHITWHYSDRRGIVADIFALPCRVAKINTAYDNFFKVLGPRLWNKIPKYINIITCFDTFKMKLDNYLLTLPDCPPVEGYTTANNNSLLVL